MEQKINIAELLKNCPKGMELDCTMYNNVTLLSVGNKNHKYPIKILRSDGCIITLTEYGQYTYKGDAKCVIFPKGKTTWKGFVPPCKFKDGDVVVTTLGSIAIISNKIDNKNYDTYCGLFGYSTFSFNVNVCPERHATEEEKQNLFQAIKDNNYKWNADTKTLEKLVEPKFKVGDRIRNKDIDIYCTLGEYLEGISVYRTDIGLCLTHKDLEYWELVPDKFDITTLKPFDKVLVRNTNKDSWKISMFGYISKGDKQYFMCIANSGFYQCVPYEPNEHLLGTTNDCSEFYKTW